MTAAIELSHEDTAVAERGTVDAGRRHAVHRLHRARVRPAPRREPRYDDEAPTVPLRLVRPGDPVLPFAEPALPDTTRLVADLDVFDMRPTARRDLPDPEPFGRMLVQAVLEVLAGRRNPTQLVSMLSSSVHAGLTRDLTRRSTPLSGPTPHVRSVHVCEPADGVAELSVVVLDRGRSRAVAARLEGLDRRWRCVRLQIG